MSTQQRVLISVGGSLLVVMMVVGAFAVGFYVGDRSSPASSGGPFVGGPGPGVGGPGAGAAAQPGPPPDGALPSGLPRLPDLVGTIESVFEDGLALRTPEGPRTVVMDDDTEVVQADGSQGAREELRRGRRVAVVGRPEAGGRALVAETIVLLPPPP